MGCLAPVLVQLVVEIVPDVRTTLKLAVPYVPAGWDVGWIVGGRVAVQVLAEQSGAIASSPKPRGYRRVFPSQVSKFHETAQGWNVAQNAVVVGVLPGKERGTGRAT